MQATITGWEPKQWHREPHVLGGCPRGPYAVDMCSNEDKLLRYMKHHSL